jgi:hypothetical protein
MPTAVTTQKKREQPAVVGPLLSLKRRPHKNLGHGSQWDLKPRITVMAWASINLTD